MRAVNTPGKYNDEHESILRVVRPQRKQWISQTWAQRLEIQGRRRDLGLGACPLVGLAGAREGALENRRVARAGGDPCAQMTTIEVSTTGETFEAVLALKRAPDSGR